MTALRAPLDRLAVLRDQLLRSHDRLMSVWQDEHAREVERDVFASIDRQTARIVEAVTSADREVDAALRALRNLGAHI